MASISNLVAFLWGFAEATLFFIVPDVGLSFIALQGTQPGLAAAGYALLGALAGGTIMYFWGRSEPERAAAVLHRIPLIPPEDIAKVQADLEKMGPTAMLFGPMAGIPYKIYAVYAHRFSSFPRFILISIPARGVRFVLVSLSVSAIAGAFPDSPYVRPALALLWAAVYVFYFFQKRK